MDTGSHLLFGTTLTGLAMLHPEVSADPVLFQAMLTATMVGSQAAGFRYIGESSRLLDLYSGASRRNAFAAGAVRLAASIGAADRLDVRGVGACRPVAGLDICRGRFLELYLSNYDEIIGFKVYFSLTTSYELCLNNSR